LEGKKEKIKDAKSSAGTSLKFVSNYVLLIEIEWNLAN